MLQSLRKEINTRKAVMRRIQTNATTRRHFIGGLAAVGAAFAIPKSRSLQGRSVQDDCGIMLSAIKNDSSDLTFSPYLDTVFL